MIPYHSSALVPGLFRRVKGGQRVKLTSPLSVSRLSREVWNLWASVTDHTGSFIIIIIGCHGGGGSIFLPLSENIDLC
jgi:hypothetical protein